MTLRDITKRLIAQTVPYFADEVQANFRTQLIDAEGLN